MSTQVLATIENKQTLNLAIEKALIEGDLAPLSVEDRLKYYHVMCDSLGLNPLTKPFEYVKLNGKLTLYARKDCTDQIRNNKKISVEIKDIKIIGDIYIVIAIAKTKEGRIDESTGAVNIKGFSGDHLANAYMKAETKAKRRVTLSICGLGFPDESELETMKAVKVDANYIESNTNQNAMPKELPVEPIIRLFSSDDPFQLDWLESKLKELNIAQDCYDEIALALNGKAWNKEEFDLVVNKYLEPKV